MNLAPEDFADAVVDTLRRDLPAALLAQSALYLAADVAAGREVPLDPPAFEDYYVGGVGAVLKYPTVEVAIPDMAGGEFSMHQEDADIQMTAIVRAFDRHAQMPILYRKMSRLGAALISVLVHPGAFRECEVEAFRGAWRFNPETEELDTVVSGVLLAFTLNTTMLR